MICCVVIVNTAKDDGSSLNLGAANKRDMAKDLFVEQQGSD